MGSKRRMFVVILSFCLMLLTWANTENLYNNDDDWSIVYIPQRKIGIAIPKEFEVITQDTVKSDLVDDITLKNAISTMKAADIYLDAFLPSIDADFVVNIKNNSIRAFSEYSERTKKDMLDSFLLGYEALGLEIISSEIVDINDISFFKIMSYNDINGEKYSLQYITFIDSQHICIGVSSFGGEINKEEECILEEIVKRSMLSKYESE